ncbi:hypothetical protein M422DRAFT_43910 [Sphaerobolus stellatus SS14]|nr:hypothetical protein M422DRAFT_43910 [Sphaerobolus stellatus SS14]
MSNDRKEGSLPSSHSHDEKSAIGRDYSSTTFGNGTSFDEPISHIGVKTVEATHKVFGKYTKWALFIGLALSTYIYSLDGQTTYYYLALAASSLGDHGLIASVQVAQSIITAVGKPVVAKIADVHSRGIAYAFVLVFYVIGYIVIASANNIETIGGGIVLYAMGYTGLQLLTQIIIADITSLQWRALVNGLTSLPFVINAFVGGNIATSILTNSTWRWGYGMFAILIPVSLAPLIVTLLWAERKAKKLGIVNTVVHGGTNAEREEGSLIQRMLRGAEKLDILGLVLIGTSVALILLPLTLAPNSKGGWKNPSMIAMIVVGFVVIPIFAVWEAKFAKFPVFPRRFLSNRSAIIASAIGFLDFISFYLSFSYLYSFVLIVKPWTLVNVTYFIQTQTVALTVFAIMCGVLMRFLHRGKWLLVAGLTIRLAGAGLMINSRGADAPDAEIVWSQLLQGIGGGFAAVAAQTNAQASVTHTDVAMVTAVVLLLTEIGGAVGSAIGNMPARLAKHLPFLSQADRDTLYGSLYAVAAYPQGDPVRAGVILAYSDVMKIMTIAATAVAVLPLILAFFMPDWYLGTQQNAIDNVDLAGEKEEGKTTIA